MVVCTLTSYLLSLWCRVLLDKLIGLKLVKRFPAFLWTRRFITALKSIRHLSLSLVNPVQSIYPHPTSWRSILLLYTHLRLGPPVVSYPPVSSARPYSPPFLTQTRKVTTRLSNVSVIREKKCVNVFSKDSKGFWRRFETTAPWLGEMYSGNKRNYGEGVGRGDESWGEGLCESCWQVNSWAVARTRHVVIYTYIKQR